MTSEEFDFIAADFKKIIDPELVLIAEIGEKPVGFSLALHAAWFVPITVLGLWALLRAGLTLGELRRGPA